MMFLVSCEGAVAMAGGPMASALFVMDKEAKEIMMANQARREYAKVAQLC